jgi:hypothetical protein
MPPAPVVACDLVRVLPSYFTETAVHASADTKNQYCALFTC